MYHPFPADSLTAKPAATPLKRRPPRVQAPFIASDKLLLQYIEGWKEAERRRCLNARLGPTSC